MPKVTNAFSAYNSNTNKEQLADVIYNISPTETPLVNSIGRTTATSKVFEWSTESLEAVNLNNAFEEGFVAQNQAYVAPTRLGNSCQILSKNIVVTRSQERSQMAGVRSTVAHVTAMRSQEIKRDLEAIVSQNQPQVLGSDSVPRKTRAMEHWITSNVSLGTGGANGASPTAALNDGTTRAYTETLLLDALQQGFLAGAEPSLLLMHPTQKRKFSAFAGRTNSQVKVDSDEVVQSVDIYVSDFGTLKALPSRFVRNRVVMAIDPKMASLAYFDDFKLTDLAKTGDTAAVKLLTVEVGLRVNNEAAHVKIADLN